MRLLIIAVCLALACSGSDEVAVDDQAEEQQPDPDCLPQTCSELGAACGSIDSGCGTLIDCGGCESGVCGDSNQCETDGACAPASCDDLGAQCGLIDDGCGGTVECDGCAGSPGTICSEDNQCIVASCGGDGKNECGSCGTLPATPGEDCLCGGSAECTIYGLQCTDDDGQAFEPISDGYDDTLLATGAMDLSLQHWDYDEYTIEVQDDALGRLDPEFLIRHPGGYELNVCVIMDGQGGPIESYCGDEGTNFVENGVRRGCCATLVEAGEQRIELDFPFAPFTDYSADYTLQVRGVRSDELGSTDSCEPYEIAFGF